MKGGKKKVGNHAPPIALIVRIKKVPRPLACAVVLLKAARTIPNAVAAAEEQKMTRKRLPKFEKISISKNKYPAKKRTVN